MAFQTTCTAHDFANAQHASLTFMPHCSVKANLALHVSTSCQESESNKIVIVAVTLALLLLNRL